MEYNKYKIIKNCLYCNKEFILYKKRIKHIYSTSVKKEDIEEVKTENIKRLF